MTTFGQAILKGCLQPRHLTAGIYLEEPDDHGVTMLQNGTVQYRYGMMVSIAQLRHDADELLEGKE